MGSYLSMRGNRKPDVAANVRPDENFAREILQLFSIGLIELNPDGTPVLAIGPTLALGVVDGDAVRVAVAVALALAAVIAGAVRRLQGPLCLGAAALIVIGLDQWGADLVRMPRWITLGAAGVLLMWIGATFEHRRRDWRRAAEVIGNFG